MQVSATQRSGVYHLRFKGNSHIQMQSCKYTLLHLPNGSKDQSKFTDKPLQYWVYAQAFTGFSHRN